MITSENHRKTTKTNFNSNNGKNITNYCNNIIYNKQRQQQQQQQQKQLKTNLSQNENPARHSV